MQLPWQHLGCNLTWYSTAEIPRRGYEDVVPLLLMILASGSSKNMFGVSRWTLIEQQKTKWAPGRCHIRRMAAKT